MLTIKEAIEISKTVYHFTVKRRCRSWFFACLLLHITISSSYIRARSYCPRTNVTRTMKKALLGALNAKNMCLKNLEKNCSPRPSNVAIPSSLTTSISTTSTAKATCVVQSAKWPSNTSVFFSKLHEIDLNQHIISNSCLPWRFFMYCSFLSQPQRFFEAYASYLSYSL